MSDRVNRYYRNFRKTKASLDKFMEENSDVMEQLDALTEEYNSALAKLEKVCRDEGAGAGPILSSRREKTIYDGEFLYEILKDNPRVRDELITVEYKVKKGVFDKLARDGVLTAGQVKKGVTEVRKSVVLTGVPNPLNII